MKFSEYAEAAKRTAPIADHPDVGLAVFGLGLSGEAGEVAELLKKHIGHGIELDREKLCKELGDVLWYLAAVADSSGIPLEEVAEANVAKLRERYPDGFVAGGGVR